MTDAMVRQFRRPTARRILLLCVVVTVGLLTTVSGVARLARAQAKAPMGPQAPGLVRLGLGAAVDEHFERLAGFGFSGSILVAQHDSVVLAKGYGAANAGTGTRASAETVYYAASIAKQFTAAAVMVLVQEGRLTVHDSLYQLLPDVPTDKRAITLHQLMTHSSGLTGYHTPEGGRLSRAEWTASLLATPLEYAPGSKAAYSNAGFSLLASIIEYTARQPFETFLSERIFVPAGIRHTDFASRREAWPDSQVAHGIGSGIKGDPHAVGLGWPKGSSGLLTSVEDLWRWELAQREGRVLSRRAFEQMYAPYITVLPGSGLDYGYGWRVNRTADAGLVEWVSGLDQPFSAMYRRYVDVGVTVIVLSNGAVDGVVWRDILFHAVRDGTIGQIVGGTQYTLPPWWLSASPVPLERYQGTYRMSDGTQLDITVDGEALRVWPRHQALATAMFVAGADTGAAQLAKLTARVEEALRAADGDTNTTLGFGPFSDEGIERPSPTREFGRYVGTEWLVTLPVQSTASTTRATTYGMLRFERGSFPMRWRWWNASPYGRDVGLGMGILPPFRPQSASQFVAYQAGLQRTLVLRFGRDTTGSRDVLTLQTASGVLHGVRSEP